MSYSRFFFMCPDCGLQEVQNEEFRTVLPIPRLVQLNKLTAQGAIMAALQFEEDCPRCVDGGLMPRYDAEFTVFAETQGKT